MQMSKHCDRFIHIQDMRIHVILCIHVYQVCIKLIYNRLCEF